MRPLIVGLKGAFHLAVVDVKEIIEAGVHFGHRVSRWHPKMAPFIFGKRNLIHIIDIRETLKGLVRASNFLTQLAASGKQVVFVGTKRQAKAIIQREAERCGMHWSAERWLGGTLTNFHTIRGRLKRLEELEALESSGGIEQYSKKHVSRLRRERRKILRNLEGLRKMKELPGAMVVIDIRREHIAVGEARKMGIPVVAVVDTDCDPRLADIVIPGNDDAYRSIQIVLETLASAVATGKDSYARKQAELERARQEEEAKKAEEAAKAKAAAQAQADALKAGREKAQADAAAKAGGGAAPAAGAAPTPSPAPAAPAPSPATAPPAASPPTPTPAPATAPPAASPPTPTPAPATAPPAASPPAPATAPPAASPPAPPASGDAPAS